MLGRRLTMGLAAIVLTAAPATASPSLIGSSGLLSVPDATILTEGTLALGFSWIDGPDTYLFAPRTNRIYSLSVGILPGVEGTFRATQVIGWHDPEAPGFEDAIDRMFNAKARLPLPEPLPRIAVGIQDLFSINALGGIRGAERGQTQYGQSTAYAVTEHGFGPLRLVAGYGVSPAFIDGLFGGIDWQLIDGLHLLGEYDSRSWNAGLRWTPLPWAQATVGLLAGRTLGLSGTLLVPL